LRMLLLFCAVRAHRNFAHGRTEPPSLDVRDTTVQGGRVPIRPEELMNGKKIAIVAMAGALIFSLARLIAQKVDGFRGGRSPCRGMPLLCRVLGSNRCNSKILRMAPKSLPCGLVTGKSLMYWPL